MFRQHHPLETKFENGRHHEHLVCPAVHFLGGVFLFSAYSLWKKDKNYYMRIIPTIYLAVQRQGIFVGNE